MAVRPLALLEQAPQPEPCCHPVSRCLYRPSQIANWLRDLDTLAQSGLTPVEALQSVLSSHDPYNDDRGSRTAGVPLAAGVMSDLSRAFKAGKRNPQAIAEFLCPFALECDD